MTQDELFEEKLLIEEARRDPDKFGILFDRYYQPIFNYCLRRVADVAVAQDVSSEVFYKAYKKLWQFQWKGLPFVAWLYRIANNEIKSYYRKGKRIVVSVEELREESGYEPADMADVEAELVEAEEKLLRYGKFLEVKKEIGKLDYKYQEVLHLRFFENLKIREIGEVLGKSPGTVKSLVSRGLSRLRSVVEREDEAEQSLVYVKSLLQSQKLAYNGLLPHKGERVVL